MESVICHLASLFKNEKENVSVWPHQASLALVLKRNQKWITGVRFFAASESYRGRFLRTCIHGSILKTGRSHHGIIYGFFLFSFSGFDEGWNAGTEKRVSIHTELHTRSSPPNDHSANHVTHRRFDMPKGGALFKRASTSGNNAKISGDFESSQ